MGLIEKYKKNLNGCDLMLVKLAVFFATLFLVTAWPTFRSFILGFAWYWYFGITILLVLFIVKRVWK